MWTGLHIRAGSEGRISDGKHSREQKRSINNGILGKSTKHIHPIVFILNMKQLACVTE